MISSGLSTDVTYGSCNFGNMESLRNDQRIIIVKAYYKINNIIFEETGSVMGKTNVYQCRLRSARVEAKVTEKRSTIIRYRSQQLGIYINYTTNYGK